MPSSLVPDYVTLAVSLLLSALFSGVEIAYLSANRLRLELDRKQHSLTSRIVQLYVEYPGQFIASILVGNNIAIVLYGIAMQDLLQPWLISYSADASFQVVSQTIISTIIILILAEFLPKALFRTHPNAFLKVFAFPIFFFYILLYPISRGMTWLSSVLLGLIMHEQVGDEGARIVFGKTDLNHLVDEFSQNKPSEDDDEDLEHEIKIFQNALEFSDIKVRECFIPRTDIVGIELTESVDKLCNLFISSSYSRIPVYEDSVDNILGYVNAKAIFRHPAAIRDVMIELPFVPETMKAGKLLTQFIRTSSSMAIVVDEFGGTAGLITIEDIVEEIFGDIQDEHDTSSVIMKCVAPGRFVFSGRAEVEAINEHFDLGIPEVEAYDTIAGYILDQEPSIPKPNDELEIGPYRVKILRVDGSRIKLVELTQDVAASS